MNTAKARPDKGGIFVRICELLTLYMYHIFHMERQG